MNLFTFDWLTGTANDHFVRYCKDNGIAYHYDHFGKICADLYGIGILFHFDYQLKETYKEICAAYSEIKTADDFYRIIKKVNENPNYSVDLINCAREQMRIFNSAQFQEVTQH